jgi:hypothetical protein
MGFLDFLKKTGVVKTGKQTWKGDASKKPVDDPLRDAEMQEMENKTDDASNSNDNNSSDW